MSGLQSYCPAVEMTRLQTTGRVGVALWHVFVIELNHNNKDITCRLDVGQRIYFQSPLFVTDS